MNTHRHADTESLAQTTRNRSPRKHVRDRGPSLGPGDLTPPSSDSQRETEVPRMLMSPPPEETLRVSRARTNSSPDKRTSGSSRRSRDNPSSPSRTTKRKRNHIPSLTSHDEGAVASSSRVTLEATPNPKPRKQHRRQTSSIEAPTTPTKSPSRASVSPSKRSLHRSPRADNPQADYLPSIPLHDGERTTARHRSQTPLPHYEPPPERFTPPREILYTPVTAVSKSSKRKTAPPKSQQKSRRLTLQIKTEPPPIDLNAPPPPPSPSDDPLLLYGPKRRTRPPRASMSSVRSRDTPPISSSPVHILHQEDEPIAELDFHAMDVDTDDDEGNVLPVFNFPTNDAALDAPWSDDDEPNEEFEHTGEYTGRFMMLKVPTKMDPPSSATKQRMDQWGRPISPFPLPKKPSSGFARPYSPIPESPPRGEEAPELPIADDDVHELAIAEDRDLPVSPTPQRRDSPLFSHQDYDSVEEDPTEQRYSSPISPEQPHIDQDGYENDEAQVSDPQDDATQEVEDEVDILPDRTDGGDEFLVPIAGDDSSDLDYGEYNPPVVEEPVLADESSRQADAQPPVLQNQSPDEAASIEEDPGTVASATVTAIHSGIDIPTTEGGSLEERQHLATRVIPDIHVPPSSSTDIVYPNVAQQPNDSTSGPRPTTLETLGPGPSRVECPDSTHATVADVPTQDEWSFAIPENVGEQDEDADLEDEEDAASVVRELSREPEDIPLKALPVSSLPAPSAVDSPQNPFQTQARSSERSVEPKQNLPNRLQTYPDPSFSLPDDDDEADLSLLDPSVVKITSNDPMAAARAAAILRLHKYDCIENVASPRKQDTSDVHSFVKGSGRKSLLQSGITKRNRRSSVHRSILSNGDTSLSDLLREAEATVLLEESHLHGLSPAHPKPTAPHKPFKTPSRSVSTPWGPLTKRSVVSPKGPREWTKADWKQLDSCYTEERMALGGQRGLGVDELAPADDVDPEKVVDRFMEVMGGEHTIIQLGTSWTRDNLLKRARALRRKQAGGKVAPPSRRPSIAPADNLWTPALQYSTLLSPNASVLENRDAFSTPHQFPTRVVNDNSREIQPNHAALLHEAHDIARDNEDAPITRTMEGTASRDDAIVSSPHITPLLPGAPSHTLASKLKGLIFSYLPSPRSAPPPKRPPVPVRKGPVLPVPPPEMFQKPRAPIKTPAPKALPKPVAPKELVRLHPAPPKPSKIPRPTPNLGQVAQHTVPVSASSRRDSGASVKDLVRTFETMEKMHADERESLRRLESQRKRVQRPNEGRGVSKLPRAVWRS